MSLPHKLDPKTASVLRSFLSRKKISTKRVIIDLNKDTVEADNDFKIDDLLTASGTLSSDRVEELLQDVRKSREEWDNE